MDVAEATEREAAVADAATIEASMERETMAAGMKVTVATDMEAAERAPVATVTEAAKREAARQTKEFNKTTIIVCVLRFSKHAGALK